MHADDEPMPRPPASVRGKGGAVAERNALWTDEDLVRLHGHLPGEVTARSLRCAGLRGDAVRDSCVAASTAGAVRSLLVPHVLHSVWPRPRRDPRAGAGASSALFSRLINPSRQNGPAAYGNHRSPRGLLPDQAVVPGVFFCRRLLRGQVIGAIRWPTDCLADQRPSAHDSRACSRQRSFARNRCSLDHSIAHKGKAT
jgi:hypothetical protein